MVAAAARAPGSPDGPPVKWTIAQWQPGHADLRTVAEELAAAEPGWGGSATIVGSPRGRGSALPTARILATVRAHLAEE